jgi:hypothetical protein
MQVGMALTPNSLARRWSERQILRLVLGASGHDHPNDHPDDPTASSGTRRDRWRYPREQRRSDWNRPFRRWSADYGSGGQAMAVLAAAAPCGPVPGRTSGVAVDGCAAGCPAWRCRRAARRCRRRRCPQRREPAAAGVHKPRPLSERPDRRCPPAARTWRGTPAGVYGTGHRGFRGGQRPSGQHPAAPRTHRGHGRSS